MLVRSIFPVLITAAVVFSSSAHALQIDFESLAHGEVVTTLGDVTVTALNPNRSFDIAAAFDSNEMNTRDPDLEANNSGGPIWSGGNLANTSLGTVIILQENYRDCSKDVCSQPDDEGRRPAGSIAFSLGTAVTDFGFDLVDLEGAVVEGTTITFFDGTNSANVSIGDFLDSNSSIYDPSIVLGNNTANRFQAISAASIGLGQIDQVRFNLGGSTAIDNLNGTVVPEPGSAVLIGLGLVGLGMRRQA